MSDDWQEKERARCEELAHTYNRLVELVTERFKDIEETRIGKLAKAMACGHIMHDHINDLHFHHHGNVLPVHVVDGKPYPSVSYAVTGFVPLWALYLSKAREAIELLENVEKKEAA